MAIITLLQLSQSLYHLQTGQSRSVHNMTGGLKQRRRLSHVKGFFSVNNIIAACFVTKIVLLLAALHVVMILRWQAEGHC